MTVGDWDRRELCPDGSCTGLIGPEGTCKVCGRVAPNWGEERKRGTQDVADDDADEDDEDEDEDDAAEPDPIKPATKVAIGGGEWASRALCPDGGCVGLIGPDGTCKVCGKVGVVPAAADAATTDDDDEDYDDDDEDNDSDDGDGDDADDDVDDHDDSIDDELAAAADELAGVASVSEVASANSIAKAAESEDEDNRKLCPDGACIGVIGPDGKCKICRKDAA